MFQKRNITQMFIFHMEKSSLCGEHLTIQLQTYLDIPNRFNLGKNRS